MKIDDLYFTETLTIFRDGFAKTEIINNSDKSINIVLKQPIQVIPRTQWHKNNLDNIIQNKNSDAFSGVESYMTSENEQNNQSHKNNSLIGEPGDINQVTDNFLENLIELVDDPTSYIDINNE